MNWRDAIWYVHTIRYKERNRIQLEDHERRADIRAKLAASDRVHERLCRERWAQNEASDRVADRERQARYAREIKESKARAKREAEIAEARREQWEKNKFLVTIFYLELERELSRGS